MRWNDFFDFFLIEHPPKISINVHFIYIFNYFSYEDKKTVFLFKIYDKILSQQILLRVLNMIIVNIAITEWLLRLKARAGFYD